ncbi:hypothetical protein BCR34DRAFT_580093 [Clohesyomyces aquaticus]|uniref:Zn(2)-C6 fungal-type domain-containing protein n=1 Tax=Clohesyomyces aquaticus TaxID=1231657 RepID=A0A1Y1Y8E5_9PLEO|nr:hypothetical protein BCR34DRAFT_580093 [Clohesyomyces aquaticus]
MLNPLGCFTCKSRHSRCDEKKPVCGNCLRLNLECKPSDFIAPSAWNTIFEASSSTQPETGAAAPLPIAPSPQASVLEGPPTSTWDVFRSHMQGLGLDLDDSPPMQHLLYSTLPTPGPTPDKPLPSGTVSLNPETAFLLQTFLQTVARWMDLFDHSLTYQLKVPPITLTCPLLFHCTCALAAKHLALARASRNTSWTPISQYHYGEALRELIETLNSPSRMNPSTLLTAINLLSSYELMGSMGQEHRRHFLAEVSLIKSYSICARSTGLDRANFWIYVRHEIAVALATERPLLLSPEEWGVHWEDGERREDVLGNHVLWLLARVINVVYGEEANTSIGRAMRNDLLQELEQWRAGLSGSFIGVPYGDNDEEGFQRIYFTVPSAAAAAFWYHVTYILLYAEPVLQDAAYIPEIQRQAMKVTNIAISDFPDPVRVFATHGLYYAAKHIDGLAQKARVWNILKDVENELGYHTRSVVKRLQDLVEQGI